MKNLFVILTLIFFLCHTLWAEDDRLDLRFQRAMTEGVQLAQEGGEEPNIRATARFKEAVRLKPRSGEARCRLALSYLDRGDYLGAEENAEKATHLAPDHYLPWLILGSAEFYLGKKATESLEKSLQLDPSNAHTTYMLGRCYYFMDTPKEAKRREELGMALKYFKRTLELEPTYVAAQFMVGCCWLDLNMPAVASGELQSALRAEPNNAEIYLRLGLCAIAMKTFIHAEQHFREAIRRRPDHAEAHLLLADLQSTHLSNKEEAVINYHRFLELSGPQHSERKRIEALLDRKEVKAK